MSRTKSRPPTPPSPDDPVALARAGDELKARLAKLRATIEAKRRIGWAFTPRGATS